jgi:hypothetical protein
MDLKAKNLERSKLDDMMDDVPRRGLCCVTLCIEVVRAGNAGYGTLLKRRSFRSASSPGEFSDANEIYHTPFSCSIE